MQTEEPAAATNEDATSCKRYAVSLGYWDDPYISFLSKQPSRKTPEINRGYYARVYAVKKLVKAHIKRFSSDCQIISLGSGFDSLYWNLCMENILPLHYVEVDFPSITRLKTMLIQRSKDKLLSQLGEDVTLIDNKSGIMSEPYSLVPADLKDQDKLLEQLKRTQLNFDKPTLVIAECVLMYIPDKDTDALLSFIFNSFSKATFISYDVVNMCDRFAEVMLANLQSRQCTLFTANCLSKETQIERYKRNGWKTVQVWDMNEVYTSIPASERNRVEKIEMLDEVHLLQELLTHYCICIAGNSTDVPISIYEESP